MTADALEPHNSSTVLDGSNKISEHKLSDQASLYRWTRLPQRLISFEKDEAQHFGVRPTPTALTLEQFEHHAWGKGGDFILDFGVHMVGYLSIKLESRGSHMDAPCRLRLTFGESPYDVILGMENVKSWISTAWLPDEVINIDMCPETIRMPRRHAFRFLRIEVIDTSLKYKVAFREVKCECVSAIGLEQQIEMPSFKQDMLAKIDHACISTLRDCMQTVFEDGPRRDRRLWVGDLRLQALANYETFKDAKLVKDCILAFAAVARDDGSVPACLFELPKLSASSDYIVDYDALFAAVVNDYVVATKDVALGHEVWPLVVSCVKNALAHLHPETGAFDENLGKEWKFLDWQQGLDHNAGLHGLLLFCLKSINNLADILGKERPYDTEIARMTEGASLFLSKESLFVSGPKSQISFASASWLVLSEAFPKETARTALLNTLAHPDAVRPLTPYLWHYVLEALATVGCFDKCVEIMTEYWGGMILAGADTFWECYDPKDSRNSPYGDVRNNSFCHAWSCTPTYLLRGKLREFVIEDDGRKQTMGELDDIWIKSQIGS